MVQSLILRHNGFPEIVVDLADEFVGIIIWRAVRIGLKDVLVQEAAEAERAGAEIVCVDEVVQWERSSEMEKKYTNDRILVKPS